MVGVQGSSSPLPAVGMLVGFVLLGFAGVVVLTPSSSSAGAAQLLPRRLQDFGYITTSRAPSSFDSSDSSSSASSLEPSKSFESGSMESSDIGVIMPKIQASLGSGMGYVTISLLIQLLFAVCYNKLVPDPVIKQFGGNLDDRMMMQETSPDNDFTNSFLDFRHPNLWVCAQGLCCPMVRMASTNAISGVCGFWETMWCYCCCAWLTVNTGPVCLVLFWRMRLKDIMRTEQNVLTDFFLTLLCPQISLCQMSVAAEEAMGYTTSGCCSYTPYSYDSFSGAP